MPDLPCPDRCDRDHDGLGTGRDLSAADAAVEQLHRRHLVRMDLGDSLSAEVDLQRGLDGKTVLTHGRERPDSCAGAHVRSPSCSTRPTCSTGRTHITECMAVSQFE